MSFRGVLAAAVLVAAAATVPSSAAASPYVVYEAYHAKPGGVTQIPIRAYVTGPALTAQLELAPADEGGYQTVGFGVGTLPAGAKSSDLWLIHVVAGHRYLFVGPRGRTTLKPLGAYWKVRPTTIGFRTLTLGQSVSDYYSAGGVTVSEFHSASVPGGPYGSVVWATVPCGNGVGLWSVGTDAEPAGQQQRCMLSNPAVYRDTFAGRKWVMTGPIVGPPEPASEIVFVVCDFPKR